MDSYFKESFIFGHPSHLTSKELEINVVDSNLCEKDLRSSEALIFIPEHSSEIKASSSNVFIGVSASAGYHPYRIYLITDKFNSYIRGQSIKVVQGIKGGPFLWRSFSCSFHPPLSSKIDKSDASTQTIVNTRLDKSSSQTENFDNQEELFEIFIHSILAPFTLEIFEYVYRKHPPYLKIGEFLIKVRSTCEYISQQPSNRRHSAPTRPLDEFDLVTKLTWIHHIFEIEETNLLHSHQCMYKYCLISWLLENSTPENEHLTEPQFLLMYVHFLISKFYLSKDRHFININLFELINDFPSYTQDLIIKVISLIKTDNIVSHWELFSLEKSDREPIPEPEQNEFGEIIFDSNPNILS
jgi:hypothetical protein